MLAKAILRDRFFRVGTMLFVATMVTHLFNFLFQVTMGRMLSPSDYGTLNALLSILMIAAIPFMTIMMVLARQASIFNARKNLAGIRRLFRWSYKRLYAIGVPAFLLFLLTTPFLKGFLHLESIIPITLMGVVILLSMSFPMNLALLQGLQRFIPLAIANGSLGPLKYGFCVALVFLGFGINGVFAGHILCYLALFVLSYWPIRKSLHHITGSSQIPQSLFATAYPEFMANLAFAFLTQFDLVLVKHLFSSQLAGTYAIAAVFGRAVMYLPVSLVLAFFPMVAESHALRQDPKHFLWKALSFTLLLSGSGTLLLWLFPEYILSILFGGKYMEAASLLALYGVAMLPMALLMVVMNFYIAQGRNRVWRLMAVGAVLEVVLISLQHEHLGQILAAVFIGGTVSLALSFYPLVWKHKSHAVGSGSVSHGSDGETK
jgi:O-antigen/teichoic acid export membrane protein